MGSDEYWLAVAEPNRSSIPGTTHLDGESASQKDRPPITMREKPSALRWSKYPADTAHTSANHPPAWRTPQMFPGPKPTRK